MWTEKALRMWNHQFQTLIIALTVSMRTACALIGFWLMLLQVPPMMHHLQCQMRWRSIVWLPNLRR
uniref:Uncharacterized protein n=1 Tax=Arundo donax TaxID=35708 RepID=A0A0A9ICR0_ARUDO